MSIQVAKLGKSFGPRLVLQQLDWEVARGEFVVLAGPNGVGKTTLLWILASLIRPSFGQVWVEGMPLPQEAARVRRQIGVVGHQPFLYGDLSAEENLRFYAQLYGLNRYGPRIRERLDQVGLLSRREEPVRSFSRGMQQRLSLARALLHDPLILLLDEPYAGLDLQAGRLLDGMLREVASQGRTIVMTSHDLLRAAPLADRIDVLNRGRIAASFRRGEFALDQLPSLYQQALASHG
ncbi:MAG: heme ABC exporter ATP-binding protein CcmA [Anaerolineales bacterium]|jgi:heme exporter protein A